MNKGITNVIVYISKLPKTSISTIVGAIVTFLLAKGYIDGDTAMLISSIFVGLGVSINVATNNGKVQNLK